MSCLLTSHHFLFHSIYLSLHLSDKEAGYHAPLTIKELTNLPYEHTISLQNYGMLINKPLRYILLLLKKHL